MYSNYTSTFLEIVTLPPYTQQTFCKLRFTDSQTTLTEAKQLATKNFNQMYAQF
jgi:hypothetical protein